MNLRGKSALLFVVLVASVGMSGPPAHSVDIDPLKNVVLIMTDDMTAYDLQWMPITRSVIENQGTEFTNGLSEHPLCCPARAKTLTGQLAQNNGVHHNGGPWSENNLKDPENNIGRWAQHLGYHTALVGKFLNGF